LGAVGGKNLFTVVGEKERIPPVAATNVYETVMPVEFVENESRKLRWDSTNTNIAIILFPVVFAFLFLLHQGCPNLPIV
jgi:hypothetical protein